MTLLRYVLYFLAFLLSSLTLLFAALCLKIDRQGALDEAQPADCIVVLGAWVLPDGRPSEDLFVRTEHAVSLYQKNLADHIICTGGYAGDRLSAASVARSIAIAYGVPSSRILLADGSMTTQEDASQTARVMRARSWDTLILVSHPLHLYRARLLFEREGLRVYTSPTNTNLRAIKPQWRLTYILREALFIIWSNLERLGLPRSWGYKIQQELHSWTALSEAREQGYP